ncbi:PREDICTED: uncharacterized protein LOC104791282 [Camelina sativa]|uniref:Uncharacterized protein LOC104791282 n=1 Tax=Camelina sativa TaxID=90675 RepID=A0ABM0ZGJ6_CAMSA|nr:PREDICTED: uncharacterized protein LOC104791282 [Camelina sativa]
MARLEMHNSINGAARISFSNEFVEIRSEKSNAKINNISSRSSFSMHSADFAFSVTDYLMIPADEIFLKGKILPFKETSHVHRTLKEELLLEEEGSVVDRNIFSLRPISLSSSSFSTKGTWREMLGLKRTHVRSKITDEVSEANIFSLSQDHKTISGNVARKECQVADT